MLKLALVLVGIVTLLAAVTTGDRISLTQSRVNMSLSGISVGVQTPAVDLKSQVAPVTEVRSTSASVEVKSLSDTESHMGDGACSHGY